MSSTTDIYDRQVERNNLPDPIRYLDELIREKLGDDPQSRRDLAIVHLVNAGWSLRKISAVLNVSKTRVGEASAMMRYRLQANGIDLESVSSLDIKAALHQLEAEYISSAKDAEGLRNCAMLRLYCSGFRPPELAILFDRNEKHLYRVIANTIKRARDLAPQIADLIRPSDLQTTCPHCGEEFHLTEDVDSCW